MYVLEIPQQRPATITEMNEEAIIAYAWVTNEFGYYVEGDQVEVVTGNDREEYSLDGDAPTEFEAACEWLGRDLHMFRVFASRQELEAFVLKYVEDCGHQWVGVSARFEELVERG